MNWKQATRRLTTGVVVAVVSIGGAAIGTAERQDRKRRWPPGSRRRCRSTFRDKGCSSGSRSAARCPSSTGTAWFPTSSRARRSTASRGVRAAACSSATPTTRRSTTRVSPKPPFASAGPTARCTRSPTCARTRKRTTPTPATSTASRASTPTVWRRSRPMPGSLPTTESSTAIRMHSRHTVRARTSRKPPGTRSSTSIPPGTSVRSRCSRRSPRGHARDRKGERLPRLRHREDVQLRAGAHRRGDQ